MEKIFKLKEHNTNIKTELLAGLTSFFAAIYIVMVNSSILSATGVSVEPLIIATALATTIGCLLCAFLSNTSLIFMPGMGINALFSYTIVKTMGLSFYEALGAVLLSGVLFIIVAITPLSKILTESIPHSLKEAISVGIGLFITFLGFQKAGLVISDPTTLIKLGDLTSPTVLIFLVTMALTLILFLLNIPGSLLIGILFGTICSVIFGVIELPKTFFSLPDFKTYGTILFSFSFKAITNVSFWIATFSITLILVFENIGLLYGQVNGMLNRPKKTEKALNALAISTLLCGILGTSPNVSAVEGTAGIAAGGKTGLTSIVTGLLFLLSLFFIPVITIIPDIAIAPVLIIIGGLIVQNITKIDFSNISEAFPAFLTLSLIPLTFSIIDGMAFGFISYPICKIASKKYKDISPTLCVISFTFLLYFILKVH